VVLPTPPLPEVTTIIFANVTLPKITRIRPLADHRSK
jgi:hypothetical protein